MKKVSPPASDELRQEYRRADFGEMKRGKYASRTATASNVVVIDPDISQVFPNAKAVNDALRSLINSGKASTT